MARTGVTYQDVAAAAAQLIGQGKNPTVDQIRSLLGTGSSTTIINHLRQWKANQEAVTLIAAQESIPTELVALLKGLWERVSHHSEEKVTAIEAASQQKIALLQAENEKYKTNNRNWQKMHEQWLVEKNQLLRDKQTLDQAIDFAHKEKLSLTAKQETLLQQLQDKQDRIAELHLLHKQAQANIEHYRESAREQRLLMQHQHDEQREMLQHDIKAQKEQVTLLQEKLNTQQENYQELKQVQLTLEKQNALQEINLEKQNQLILELEQAKAELKQTSIHWQNEHKALQTSLNTKITQLIEAEAQIQSVSKLLLHETQMVKELQEQNKLLSYEKWEIAQLEEQMKQIQQNIPSKETI